MPIIKLKCRQCIATSCGHNPPSSSSGSSSGSGSGSGSGSTSYYTCPCECSAALPGPLQVTQNAVDVVVNNIASVTWEPVDGWEENKIRLAGYGTGQRCFPEKRFPSDGVNDKINVRVALALAIPQDMHCDVYLKLFDPDNPLDIDKNDWPALGSLLATQGNPNDNWGEYEIPYFGTDKTEFIEGEGDPKLHTVMEFNSGEQMLRKTIHIISAHAGNDYIVAAHPNEDVTEKYIFADDQHVNHAKSVFKGRTLLYPCPEGEFSGYEKVPGNMQTPTLTVWRTLHVECDVMEYYNYEFDPNLPEDPSWLVIPWNPVMYLGHSISELLKACVLINPILPSTPANPTINVSQPPRGHSPMREEQWNTILGDNPNVPSGRDIAGNSRAYWTVRIVMASRHPTKGGAGVFLVGRNTIVIFLQSIINARNDWWLKFPHETPTEHDIISGTVLHEICHCLIDGRERHVFFHGKDETTSDKSTLGVRDTMWRVSDETAEINVNDPEEDFVPNEDDEIDSDLYNWNKYRFLHARDLNEIQMHSRAWD